MNRIYCYSNSHNCAASFVVLLEWRGNDVCVYVYIYIYIYIYTYIHTHTHTHISYVHPYLYEPTSFARDTSNCWCTLTADQTKAWWQYKSAWPSLAVAVAPLAAMLRVQLVLVLCYELCHYTLERSDAQNNVCTEAFVYLREACFWPNSANLWTF